MTNSTSSCCSTSTMSPSSQQESHVSLRGGNFKLFYSCKSSAEDKKYILSRHDDDEFVMPSSIRWDLRNKILDNHLSGKVVQPDNRRRRKRNQALTALDFDTQIFPRLAPPQTKQHQHQPHQQRWTANGVLDVQTRHRRQRNLALTANEFENIFLEMDEEARSGDCDGTINNKPPKTHHRRNHNVALTETDFEVLLSKLDIIE